MAFRTSIHKKSFQFNFDARTSSGPMKNRSAWFIKLWDESRPDIFGLGECAPLDGLSQEVLLMDEQLAEWETKVNNLSGQVLLDEIDSLDKVHSFLTNHSLLSNFSSILFGIETAFLDLANGGTRTIFKTGFLTGTPIPINGLIWIGGLDYMLQQIDIKIKDGFRCIKIKVGSLNFEKECDILQYIRRKYYREDIVIRLDANGAFKTDEAMFKLMDMSRYVVHSIEQPIKPGLPEMEMLCRQSPIPIALDEELIGIAPEVRGELLKKLKPTYIILKPSLHGGLLACREWIGLANELKIGWWITSALESAVGLNAIAQFTSLYKTELPQGLGTGMIYENNFGSPLTINKGQLTYDQKVKWDLSPLFPAIETTGFEEIN